MRSAVAAVSEEKPEDLSAMPAVMAVVRVVRPVVVRPLEGSVPGVWAPVVLDPEDSVPGVWVPAVMEPVGRALPAAF